MSWVDMFCGRDETTGATIWVPIKTPSVVDGHTARAFIRKFDPDGRLFRLHPEGIGG